MKKILDQLDASQKAEVLEHLRKDTDHCSEDLIQYKQIVEDAKAERQKLVNANKQQVSYIANLEQKNAEYRQQMKMLEAEKESQGQQNQFNHRRWDQGSRNDAN